MGPSFWAYPTWADWFEAAGAPRVLRSGLGPAANMPALAIDMALQGLGVALAQQSLVADDVSAGHLVAPFPVRLTMPSPYALVVHRSARRRRRVANAVGWLKREARLFTPF